MDNNSRKKSINLFILVLIVLLVIALIITIFKLFINPQNTDDSISNDTSQDTQVKVSLETNSSSFNEVENITDSNSINNISQNTLNNIVDVSTSNSLNENTTSSQSRSLSLNNHDFTFNKSAQISLVQDNNKSAIQAIYSDFNYKMLLNTDTISFNDLKNITSLKDYIQNTYQVSITSNLKTGILNNLDLILFSISDNNGIGYCLFTPLSDSETLYVKIYNISDNQTLIDDLSNPIDEISSILSKFQN